MLPLAIGTGWHPHAMDHYAGASGLIEVSRACPGPQKIAGVPTHSMRRMRLPALAIWKEWR
jgi:hypothetical protein